MSLRYLALRKEVEEREHNHVKEMRGMTLMIEWLRAKCKREEDFRAVAAHGKAYMQLRIDLFEAWYVKYSTPTHEG
jgi:hypothetical protein